MAQLKTFLFTDICRSVDLKNEMAGRSINERDQAFIQSILVPHRQQIEAHLDEYGGRIVSTAGDGHFLVFDSSIQASLWAVEVQKSHNETPIATPDGGQVEVRISIHVGVPQIDPTDKTNFIGKSVDYASRLNDYATGEQILVSRSVMAILDDIGLEGIAFHLHGRRHLKGIGHVEVHELLYDGHNPKTMRKQPKSHSDREWMSVNPAMEFEPTVPLASGSDVTLAPVSMGKALRRIGNYELQELLGSGGMGDVYKGRHVQFNRIRAIKVIKQQYVASNNQDVIRRFYQEIKAVGALEHKNIVVAIDSSSQDDDTHYLVMEYVEGVSLHELVAQHGPLSAADACEMIRQAARGLQYIHRNNMVHRDIKPSNLMLTLVDGDGVSTSTLSSQEKSQKGNDIQGVVKILDLGLALLAGDNQERLTRFDNKAMGTGMYMSPEQWKTTSVDIRADIYSLGCTLYHLLAGDPPFYDSDLRQEKAHQKLNVPPIRRGTQIPPQLWEVLQKMLAKNPDDRYATPAEVEEALAALTEGHNLVALAQEFTASEVPPSARRPTRSNSEPQVDTWWSRTSSTVLTRRWMLRRALPLLAVGVILGFFYWKDVATRKIFEQQARETLPAFAKNAQKTLGDEINKRFAILLIAAKDETLRKQLATANANLDDPSLWAPLRDWLRFQYTGDYQEAVKANSWFINSQNGIQVARMPTKSTQGKNYSHRDYFHGLGKNLSPEEAKLAKPIRKPNLSAVYRSSKGEKGSSRKNRFKVAFSVPIWSLPAKESKEPSEVIGVLSMSVYLGEFEVLENRGGNQVVLVDLRQDSIEKERPQRGLILHHSHKGDEKDFLHPPHIAAKVLAAMDRYRESGDERFITEYDDPLAHGKKKFWGGFEKVVYTLPGQSEESLDAGWMVLVQDEVIR